MRSNTDVKPAKIFRESDQTPEFWLTVGPKKAFEAHIVHISESSFNEHIKQDWCESRGNFLTKYLKTWILTHLGLWGLSFTHLQK